MEAIRDAAVGTLMVASIAAIADAVREVSTAIEDLLNNNPQLRMRCSEEVIRFREARDALLDALSRPAEVGGLQIVRLRDAFQAAVNALLACLGLPPMF